MTFKGILHGGKVMDCLLDHEIFIKKYIEFLDPDGEKIGCRFENKSMFFWNIQENMFQNSINFDSYANNFEKYQIEENYKHISLCIEEVSDCFMGEYFDPKEESEVIEFYNEKIKKINEFFGYEIASFNIKF